jgi:hypothetical protein
MLAGVTGGVVVVAEPQLASSGLMTRTELWLLAVFVEGVIALLGGLSGWIAGLAGSRGIRDLERRGDEGGSDLSSESNGVRWVSVLGLCLLTIYSVGWLITRT